MEETTRGGTQGNGGQCSKTCLLQSPHWAATIFYGHFAEKFCCLVSLLLWSL